MSARHSVVLIPGDGVGPEVSDACVRVLAAAGCRIDWIRCSVGADALTTFGDPLPPVTLEAVRRHRVALKGPVTTSVGSGFASVNVRLRRELDLYACVRTARRLPGVACRAPELDVVIVRENTEGLYVGLERAVGSDRAEALRVITHAASRRVCRFAFSYARAQGRRRVTAVHKGNILKITDGLFLRAFSEAAESFPDIVSDDLIVDNACMQLALDPGRFDVVVTTNLFGDILSDLAAGLTGGPGVSAGANLGEDAAVFEPVHGSAPDIAGRGIVNPTASILSAVMMLGHLGLDDDAARVRKAVVDTLAVGRDLTPDLGGTASTDRFADAVISRL